MSERDSRPPIARVPGLDGGRLPVQARTRLPWWLHTAGAQLLRARSSRFFACSGRLGTASQSSVILTRFMWRSVPIHASVRRPCPDVVSEGDSVLRSMSFAGAEHTPGSAASTLSARSVPARQDKETVLRRRVFRRFGALIAEGLVAGPRARCPRSLPVGHSGREQWRLSGLRSCSSKVSGANETGEPNGEPKLVVILFMAGLGEASRGTGTPHSSAS